MPIKYVSVMKIWTSRFCFTQRKASLYELPANLSRVSSYPIGLHDINFSFVRPNKALITGKTLHLCLMPINGMRALCSICISESDPSLFQLLSLGNTFDCLLHWKYIICQFCVFTDNNSNPNNNLPNGLKY